VSPGNEAYSYLHNIADGEAVDLSQWSWDTWIQQEKRLRIMYLIFLTDAALNIWFNCAPPNWTRQTSSFLYLATMQLGTLSDQEDCARALGLRGAEAQVAVNTTGSLRLKQITMPHAMKHPLSTPRMLLNYERQMCTRNLLLSTPSTLKSGSFNISNVLALLRHKALPAMVHYHRAAPLQSNSPLRAITGGSRLEEDVG
jgi:hypothetical protein